MRRLPHAAALPPRHGLRDQPRDRYLANHRGHLMFLRPEEQEVCTADLIRALTFEMFGKYVIPELQRKAALA